MKHHTIKDWDTPKNGMFNIYIDRWWVVDEGGNPLFYSRHNHPQCNANEEIARRIAGDRPVKQIPVVYVPLRIQDYIE